MLRDEMRIKLSAKTISPIFLSSTTVKTLHSISPVFPIFIRPCISFSSIHTRVSEKKGSKKPSSILPCPISISSSGVAPAVVQISIFDSPLICLIILCRDMFDEPEQDMPHAISVTPTEQEAMDFDREVVIEAFLACDHNEELAVNYLLENAREFED